MLHQTQVPRVAAAWTAFIERFPTPEAMADGRAGRGDRGVGAARLPAARPTALGRRGDRSPRTAGPTTSPSCPGVGRYTAGAVHAPGRRRRRRRGRGEHPAGRRAGRGPPADRPRGRGRDGRASARRCAVATGCSRSWTSARSCAVRASRGAASARCRRRCATRGPLPHESDAARARRRSRDRSASSVASCSPACATARRRSRCSTPRPCASLVADGLADRRRRPRPTSLTAPSDAYLNGAERAFRYARRLAEEVAQEVVARLGEDRLGVELDAFDRELAVAEPHHEAVLALGRDLEPLGHRVAVDDQRVVPRRGERARHAGEHAAAVVRDLATSCRASHAARATTTPPYTWPMHWCPRHTPSTGTPRSPNSRIASFETPASSGRPGPGDTSTASGSSARSIVEVDGVVAVHDRLRAELTEVLDEVVDEASRSCR